MSPKGRVLRVHFDVISTIIFVVVEESIGGLRKRQRKRLPEVLGAFYSKMSAVKFATVVPERDPKERDEGYGGAKYTCGI